jgi:hypothetical protein
MPSKMQGRDDIVSISLAASEVATEDVAEEEFPCSTSSGSVQKKDKSMCSGQTVLALHPLGPSFNTKAADVMACKEVEDAFRPNFNPRKRVWDCTQVAATQATASTSTQAPAEPAETFDSIRSITAVAQDNSNSTEPYPYPITSRDRGRLVLALNVGEQWPLEKFVDHLYNINAGETRNDPQPQRGVPYELVKRQQKSLKEAREARKTALCGVVLKVLAANQGSAITGPDTVVRAPFDVAGKHDLVYRCLSATGYMQQFADDETPCPCK